MKLHTVIKAKPFDWALRLWPLGFSLAVLAVVWDLLEGDTPWIIIMLAAAGWLIFLASLLVVLWTLTTWLLQRLLQAIGH